jgi:DNA-directed RNA polymerase beta subunit
MIAHKNINLSFKSLRLTFTQLRLGKPYRYNDPTALVQEIYPQECRLASKTYTAPLLAEISREIDGNLDTFTAYLGEIPIMVRSNNCHLAGLDEN